MTYLEQLQSEAWQQKRKIIVENDNYCCSSCRNSKVIEDLTPCYIIKPTIKYSVFFGLDLVTKGEIGISIPDPILVRMTGDNIVYVKKKDMYIGAIPINGYAFSLRKMNDIEKSYVNNVNITGFNVRDKEYGMRTIKNEEILDVFESIDSPFLNFDNSYNLITFSFKQSPFLYEKSSAILYGLRNKLNDDTAPFYSDTVSSLEWVYSFGLNVHHKFYQDGRLAWDYPDEALETYCQICHSAIHSGQKIDHYDETGNRIGELTCCKRCGGQGIIPHYLSLFDGICFRCCGSRYEELIKEEYNQIIFNHFKIPFDFKTFLK